MAEGSFARERNTNPNLEKKRREVGGEGSRFSKETKRNPKIGPMVDIYFRICDKDEERKGEGKEEERWLVLTKSSYWEKYVDQGAVPPPLPEPTEDPQFVSLGSKIYASGGYESPTGIKWVGSMKFPIFIPSNKVFYFDTRRPKEGWMAVAPMNKKRMDHYVLADADAGKIYALGGHDTQHRIESPDKKRLFAEEYDTHSDTWKPLAYVGDDIKLPQPIFGHAIVDHGLLGRKILFHSYFSQNLFYLNTRQNDDVDVYDDTFGQYRSESAFLDGILYFFSGKGIYAYDLCGSSLKVKRVVLRDVKKNTLPHREFGDEAMPAGSLMSLGKGHLALTWASTPEFEISFRLHCSILEMERKGDSFKATVLNCSSHTVESGIIESCLAVSSPEMDVGRDAELGQKTESSNRQHKRKRKG